MEIQFSKMAIKAIALMDATTKQRIKSGIDGLTLSPPQGDIKRMQGFSDERLRLRVGKYRIIYKIIQGNTIEILFIMDIASRGDVYK